MIMTSLNVISRKAKSPLSFVFCAAMFAGTACAQSIECPTLPPDAATDFHWSVLQTDSALLCRALSNAADQEAFAITVTKKSPFKPDRAMREEQGKLQGRLLWWYRTEIAGRPDEFAREALLELDSGRFVHVSIRTEDAGTMSQYQQLVQRLTFAPSTVATR